MDTINLRDKPNMKKIIIICITLLAGAYPASAQQQFANLGDFKLENGQLIENCRIGYRTFGTPNKDRSNIIIFPTWFSGRSVDLKGLAAPGNMADSTKYYVIALDALGDGVSSSPSNSKTQPDSLFPKFNIRDMVRSQHQLLTEKLHINHVFGVIGGSMGGMQTFQWMVSYPDFMDKAAPWVGSTKLTSYDLLLWTAEARTVKMGLEHGATKKEILKPVNAIHDMNLYTPLYRVAHTQPSKFESYIHQSDKQAIDRFNPYDWLRQLQAMMAHDVSKPYGENMVKAAQRVHAQVLAIVNLQDHMVNPEPALNFASMIHASILKLNNDCGHLGPSCKAERVSEAVNQFWEK